MRNRFAPWFREPGERYARETGQPPPPPTPAFIRLGLLRDLLEPGEAIFLGLTRRSYPKLHANVFEAGPPLTEALMRRVMERAR